jgi:release factor glutamine methyltransferase
VADAREQFERAGIDTVEAGLDARLLAQHVLDWDAARYFTSAIDPPPAGFAERYAPLVSRRVNREPLAYITGTREFWNLTFEVSPAVLIPRPETELLVETAIERFPNAMRPIRIADLCTGSGCIAIALARERPQARLVATDISGDALAVAERNAQRLDVADRIEFLQADLLTGVSGAFDLIVANPPYVPEPERESLQPEVRDFEPPIALFGGREGLSVIERLVAASVSRLSPGALLLFEFSMGQDRAVDRLIGHTRGVRLADVKHDLQGIPRVAVVVRV